MELFDLESNWKAIASGGNVLNCQELVGLQAGLGALKGKEQYKQIYFWGKIFGQKGDYYIAYGVKGLGMEFEFPAKSFYYAGPAFEFLPLEQLSQEVAERVVELAGGKPFSGMASTPLETAPENKEEGAEGEEPENAQRELTEVDRLSHVVREIDFETAAVPLGAYSLNEQHAVVPASDFKGLSFTEASSLERYAHFRSPVSISCLRALARTDAQFYSSFLDPLEGDQPKGCWAVRADPGAALVTLRSLSWPGYVAFHAPGTPKFGGLYFGYAQKNLDLPFML